MQNTALFSAKSQNLGSIAADKPRHSCARRNPVAEVIIVHSVAGHRMIKSVLDQLLCSSYLLLFRLRMHSRAGAWERRKHAIWECLLWLFSGFLRAQE